MTFSITFDMSPLKRNEVLKISRTAADKAIKLFSGKEHEERLILGHQLQFSHDEAFISKGMHIEVSVNTAELYDRIYRGILQDDKVATWLGGKLSETHTVSYDEWLRWNRFRKESEHQLDTIIHSFEYLDPSHTAARYMGAISWYRIRSHFKNEVIGKSNQFNRALAYEFSMVTT